MTKRFSILFTYQLSTTHTYYRLPIHCIINYRPLVRFQVVSVQGVRISPCILYHFVVLVPCNSQEQSQMNTNKSHAKISCHTVSDRYSYIEWLQLWNFQSMHCVNCAIALCWLWIRCSLIVLRCLLAYTNCTTTPPLIDYQIIATKEITNSS